MFETMLSSDELLSASVLTRRPTTARDPNYENAAQDALLSRINSRPDRALQALVETVVDLCGAGSAGVSILRGNDFVWPAIAGAWAKYVDQGLPRNASPCGVVIERNATLLFDEPKRIFPSIDAVPEIREILLVPLYFRGEPRGTLWAISHDEKRFDAEDARILDRMGLIAAAIETTRRSREREQRQVRSAGDRVRNTIAVMRSIVRGSDYPQELDEPIPLLKLSSRLGAYAAGAIAPGTADTVDLWTLIAHLMSRSDEEPDWRISLSGENVAVPVEQAGPLALALHELLENAIEHGALAQPGGHVDLTWWAGDAVIDDKLHLSWLERGGRPPADHLGNGFGLELLEYGLAALTRAETHVSFDATGLRFTLVMPLH
ncbi:GAF domain-containing protein [Sphingomonas sp. NBWT7]|uniref:GAF domain-containing protein n=1 Tax=Sphingomonas sp. NBWT7 TaxID=2596913 RepID=UPI001623323E|nr:GAF domain-containing protein [Sphingomonas sp. NBWT7]